MQQRLSAVNVRKIFALNVGEEIDLQKARSKVALRESEVFRIKKFNRELVLNNAPLILNLPQGVHQILDREITFDLIAKIWSFGVISISFHIQLEEKTFQEVSRFIDAIENSESLIEQAQKNIAHLVLSLEDSISAQSIWSDYEDYLILSIDEKNVQDVLELRDYFYPLMERNLEMNLSKYMKDFLSQATAQYTERDLAMIDWNQAIIVGDHIDIDELSTILDFALCQLIILRFYDYLLDKKLSSLYKALRIAKSSFFNNQYAKYSRESAMLFIEFSDVVDQVSNSIKFIGDTYYAQVYRMAMLRFRVPDFSLTVNTKLKSLSEVSSLFSSEINERRNQIMELIIIILIAIEVVPFVAGFIKDLVP